jgi:ABC-type transport system involved in cytochrome c biogenesis permease subunit
MASVNPTYSDTVATKTASSSQAFSAYGLLAMLGSLKMTVVLFALSLVLVLVGTLAQDEMNMQEVKERYFLSWIALLHVDDFFPQAFLRHDKPIPGIIPFTGGALIGVLLMINLVAAKITRFRLQSSGGRLAAGLAFLALGIGIAAMIIFLGHNDDGLQGTPPSWLGYERLWASILAILAIGAVASGVAATSTRSLVFRRLGLVIAALLAIIVIGSLVTGFRIGEPGLRIVWQLAKGVGAGLVMLVGCQLAFGKQGGNVLLHLGVGLLMLGQFAFGDRQTEQRISLVEGQSTNTFVKLDEIELQLIRTEGDMQTVTAIPAERLIAAAQSESIISDPALPLKIRVLEYFENSTRAEVGPNNPATKGVGLEVAVAPKDKSGGAKMESNSPSAYIELLDSEDKSLGVFLTNHALAERALYEPDGKTKDVLDSVTVDGETYQFGLRLHREVKPYWVQLDDVQRINWSGSTTPRDYSSFIRIVDTETGEDRNERVWMNNPLRYRGETFYQSNYTPLPGGKELTGIQVVQNSGWLIPYVACSITALGMLVHFWGTLTRFIARRRRETGIHSDSPLQPDPFDRFSEEELSGNVSGPSVDRAASTTKPENNSEFWPVALWVSAVTLAAVVLLLPASSLKNLIRPTDRDTSFDFASAGKIPVQYGGRVMPLDAYARQTLKAMTNKDSLPIDGAPSKIQERVDTRKMSAVQWLMEVSTDSEEIRRLPMFRIDAGEVRSELDLERRESKLYSLQDIGEKIDRFTKLVEEASAKDSGDQDFKDKKLIELDLRTRQYTLAAAAFRLPLLDEIPAEFFPEGTSEQTRQMFALRRLEDRMNSLANMNAPALIPPPLEEATSTVNQPKWTPFAPAYFEMAKSGMGEDQSAAGIRSFSKMMRAYSKNDAVAFNAAVDEHLAGVQTYPIIGYDTAAVSLERWIGGASPTNVAIVFYIVAFVLGLIAMAVNAPRLSQAVWGTVAIAFLIHTIVIIARVYITGRAPVINLYSSAVFVGWAAALFGLVIERIFRYGTGNLLAAFAGFITLQVADYLTLNVGQAETMGVLQAVLDTQFWLSTHVITVSLGYVATMAAGMLGILYVISGWIGASDRTKRDLYRVVYGASCFGILFSFVGTVLGGLWADDSWGRFWGWDPKENGALLIVIWNALMLHARWDGMVKAKGFAILAIGGNIITAWSWFGTNELGIGLHSYGFTEGMLMSLAIFFAVQMAFIILGILLPDRSHVTKTVSS